MKKIKNVFIILSLVLFFTACEKTNPQTYAISGEVQMQDAQVPEITTPLAGIKVYLLKAPFTMDSLNWFTKTDILDSVLTDANGLYKYSQLLPGDYVIMATDTIVGYCFDWSASPDPVGFTMENTQKEYTVNFTTPEPIMENSESFTFKFNNSVDDDQYSRIEIWRRCRVRFGCGWWWSQPCDWYWVSQDYDHNYNVITIDYANVYHNNLFLSSSFSIRKNATNFIYEYDDYFKIEFFTCPLEDFGVVAILDEIYPMTISGDDLRDENVYDVIWHSNKVEVTRTK